MGNKKRNNKGSRGGEIVFEPKNEWQEELRDSIHKNYVTVCSGSAGTGKTLTSIATALELCQRSNRFERVVITRPLVEAHGEKLGYLPGGIGEKTKPYMMPFMDNLRVILPKHHHGEIPLMFEEYSYSFAYPQIEVCPLAFMRGRSFSKTIMIFDECQNSSPEQVKMFLTRMGENTKAIIEGDITQCDTLALSQRNGLLDAMERLSNSPHVGIIKMPDRSILRSGIVREIVSRYSDVKEG